jgi:hypothetical protein
MDHIRTFRKINGVDAGYHESNIHPANGEGRVGARGIDKNYTREQIFELAHKMNPRPNIIIKAGPNAKWYFKIVPIQFLVAEIQKQSWRDTSRCVMYVLEWD